MAAQQVSAKSRGMSFQKIDIKIHPEAVSIIEKADDGSGHTPTFEATGRSLHGSRFEKLK